MNIVFLDIDGVLNGLDFIDDVFQKTQKKVPTFIVNPENVRYLNYIVQTAKAKVVVTSDWKTHKSISEIQEILDHAGFRGEIIGATPSDRGRRGQSIASWLHQHQTECFVILDDAHQLDPLSNFVVWVDPYTGLQSKHAQKAISLLNQCKTKQDSVT